MPRFARALTLAGILGALPVAGHIGSPDVFFEGQAGPWPVRVIVRSPEVVPGLAEISIRVHEPGVEAIRVQPVRWDSDIATASAEIAHAVPGDGSLWRAESQFTTSGLYHVHVEVEGAIGTGTTIVPVHCVAAQRVEIPTKVRAFLLALAWLAVAGFVCLVGVAVKSILEPGSEVSPRIVRGSIGAIAMALTLSSIVLYSLDLDDFSKPSSAFSISAEVRPKGAPRVLDIYLDDERFQHAAALVPDHGKLMHAFLIREPPLDVFAHLHPIRVEELAYASPLPSSLPAGTYRIYADVTHETGVTQTLTAAVELYEEDASPGEPLLISDPDDSWSLAVPQEGTVYRFAEGFTLDWETQAPLQVGEELALRFQLRDRSGTPVPLEPYMGMLGHAAIRRHDGAVFIHLHPTGTVSMASWQVSEKRNASVELDHAVAHGSMEHAPLSDVEYVEFPYEFPKPGIYRLWVQVKSSGQVYTGVFDAPVKE